MDSDQDDNDLRRRKITGWVVAVVSVALGLIIGAVLTSGHPAQQSAAPVHPAMGWGLYNQIVVLTLL